MTNKDSAMSCHIHSAAFGQLSDGKSAQLYTLVNNQGTSIKITNFGAIITSINTVDKLGQFTDIVLGYDNVADYELDSYYLGAIVGRYAGRIDQGKFAIAGEEYQLILNAPDSQLHGGKQALNKKLWTAIPHQNENNVCLELSVISPDGEEGFPGEVSFTVKYTLNNQNELIVEYFATTNKPTIVNLTQHSYFNLAGHNSGTIHDHHVCINADYFLPMNERIYPTGEVKSVMGSAHDFTDFRRIGDDVDGQDQQIQIGLGYDNYWLTNDNSQNLHHYAAQVIEPSSGRTLTLYSDQPSMILYTANYIDGSHIGKDECRYQRRAALCIEPQRANNKSTPLSIENTLLTPQEPFYSQSRYVFGLEK